MLGADLLVKAWIENGVEVVFGMPGTVTLPLYDALYGCSKIRHVLVRHEHAAAFMANAYGRVTGRPGTCLVVPGPGATNASTGVADAFVASAPMVLLSGGIDTRSIGKGAMHEMDLDTFFTPITKARFNVQDGCKIRQVISGAYRLARQDRPGPVYVSIPVDVLCQDVVKPILRQLPPRSRQGKIQDGDIHRTVDVLLGSHRPIILVGEGLAPRLVQKELVRLAEDLDAPVLVSRLAKGSLPENYDLALGAVRNDPILVALVESADVALALGFRFSETASLDWELKFPQKLIQVDSDQLEIGKNYPVILGVVGDEAVFLRELLIEIKKRSSSQMVEGKTWRETVMKAKAVMERRLRPMMNSNAKPIHPLRVIKEIRGCLSRDAIVTTDPGSNQIWALYFFSVFKPNSFITSSDFASMGSGLPFAVAAKIAEPDRQVLCITGDGGFLMNCQELATAVQDRLPIVVAIFNDSGFGAIRHAQDLRYSGRRIGVDWTTPDFVELAKSFGAVGRCITEPDLVKPSLEEALGSRLPCVLDFRIDPDVKVVEALGRFP